MAEHHDRHVSEELVREHARGWEAFTQFMKYGVAATVALLVLMAIFLL
ncbi:MAG TPA: aa3-type cytochrome c oxidase subunit IV [Azospirillum sp.]|nr:aa3-type cytochrome c oxidase subunit IV [Azospirillum sp.]